LTIYLTRDDLIEIHEKVQKKFNTTSGILNKGHLETIVDIPSRTVFGKEIYPTIYQKAAALLVNITKLHAFADSNKRTAIIAVETFLQINGIDWIVPLKATRMSVIIAESENNLIDKMIRKSNLFLSNYSLDYNDTSGSLRNIEWMMNEINDFMLMPRSLRDNLLDYWLVVKIYPENKDNRDIIINEYISNLTSSTNVFLDVIAEYS
jgi:death-on-curing protein